MLEQRLFPEPTRLVVTLTPTADGNCGVHVDELDLWSDAPVAAFGRSLITPGDAAAFISGIVLDHAKRMRGRQTLDEASR